MSEPAKCSAPTPLGATRLSPRILWLEGTQAWNRNAYRRYIYIHGTPEENKIGSCASFGCIRMRSRDVIDLYRRVRKGTPVEVVPGHVGEGVSQLPTGTTSSRHRS